MTPSQSVTTLPSQTLPSDLAVSEFSLTSQGFEPEIKTKTKTKKRACDASQGPSQDTSQREKAKEVFAYWQIRCEKPLAKPTHERIDKVVARLNEGYTVADLKAAIDGCLKSPFHQGQNEERRKWDELVLICRSGVQVEKLAELTRAAAPRKEGVPHYLRNELIAPPEELERLQGLARASRA